MKPPAFVTSVKRYPPVDFGLQVFREVGSNDVSGAAAELAYRFVLALFPFFIFLAALGGFVASAFHIENPTDQIMNQLGNSLPSDASSVLRTQLSGVIESHNAGLLSIGAIGAIWAASSGIGALMKTMNRIFEVREERPLVQRYAVALFLTLLGAGLMVMSFSLFIAGQVYGAKIAGEAGLTGPAVTAFTLARWPLDIVLVLVAVAFLYWQAPNRHLPLHWITPGAVFFTIAWLAVTYLFGLYVSHFASYNATYGALGGVIVLLVWLYLTGFVILVGAEIDAVLAQRKAARAAPSAATSTAPSLPDVPRQQALGRDGQSAAVARDGSRTAGGAMTMGLFALVWALALVHEVRRH